MEGGGEVGQRKRMKDSVNVLASEAVVSSIRRLLELRDSLVCLIRIIFDGRLDSGRNSVQQAALCLGRGSNEKDGSFKRSHYWNEGSGR